MARHEFEWTLLPAPVFEHEARGFNKIPLDAITSTWVSLSSGTDEVDHMSKLVKEGHDLIVAEESGCRGCRFCEVCDQGTRGGLKM